MGIIEKLPYLKRLGVNAIELLPVHEFNELEYYAVRTGALARSQVLHQLNVPCSDSDACTDCSSPFRKPAALFE